MEANFGDNSRGNIQNLAGDKGLSNYDQPVNNTTSLVYDLPFGKGRKYASGINAIGESVIGGWRLTLINTITSGLPANLTYGPQSGFQVGSSLTYRPDQLISDLYMPESQRDPRNYLNINGVNIPAGSRPFGNAGRNTVRGPNFWQSDLGLHKSFPVFRESTRLEFRMEAFNLFNRSNFMVPNTNASSINRDSQGNPVPGGAYGRITETYPARQIQFVLRLTY